MCTYTDRHIMHSKLVIRSMWYDVKCKGPHSYAKLQTQNLRAFSEAPNGRLCPQDNSIKRENSLVYKLRNGARFSTRVQD